MFIKKNNDLKTIKDVVLNNVGLTEDEFFNPNGNVTIKDLDIVVKMIKDSISKNEHITVVGDYDADGICASAILKLTLNHLNADFSIRLPKRFSEGYGLSEKIVDEIESGLLITVDNGIATIDAIKKAKDKGLKVIVTDHHLPIDTGELPCADVIVDPNAIKDSSSFTDYCGAGIAYKLACELVDDEILKKKLLAFAAIATIGDVVPLVGDNRNIVIEGLKILNSENGILPVGLYALLDVCNLIYTTIDETTIGFKLAPMINAPGRLEDNGAEFSLNVISYDKDFLIAKDNAMQLVRFNEKRKVLKEENLKLLHKNIEENNLENEKPLVIYQEGLHEGLVGLLAGALTEEYRTPCFVFTDSEDAGFIKGSARGYGDCHIKNALDMFPDVIEKYGGHKSAAGITLAKDNLDLFIQKIKEYLVIEEISDDLFYDLEIHAGKVLNSIEELLKFAPFGEGNPKPVFLIKDYELVPRTGKFFDLMGENKSYLKLFSNCNAISFNCAEKFETEKFPKNLNLLGTFGYNYFNGREYPQISFVDFEKINKEKNITNLQHLLNKRAGKE